MSIEEEEKIEEQEYIDVEENISERKTRTVQDIGFYIMFSFLIMLIMVAILVIGHDMGRNFQAKSEIVNSSKHLVSWIIGIMVYVMVMVGMFSANLFSATVYIFMITSVIFSVIFLYTRS